MITLILLILTIIVLFDIRKWQKEQTEKHYWERINEFEAQRKEQILATAIKREQCQSAESSIEKKWQQAS
ncbi:MULTISPECIES: hypothetical protein [Enterococcus]|uniref:Uncharacterized protein n=1 Tax=Candidatus Enterococcus murrayae TaxID=2815321 RepID=A0ABS3HN20_9ENTE|nr:hypothetical protein [Enterococcus sp. MJM16]MBO0454846.1 hypothetical protein [Enterococcus sp. MJM16]